MEMAEAKRMAASPAGKLWLGLEPTDNEGEYAATYGTVTVTTHSDGSSVVTAPGARHEFGADATIETVLRTLSAEIEKAGLAS